MNFFNKNIKFGETQYNKATFMPSTDEYRKNCPPPVGLTLLINITIIIQPLISRHTIAGGLSGISMGILQRIYLRQPLYSRVHAYFFASSFGIFSGYQINKWQHMKNMGEYKYAVDFAERHSVIQIYTNPQNYFTLGYNS